MVKTSDVLLILVTFFFPPIGAFFVAGCSCELLINILLTALGFVPGAIHAFWLIYKQMQAEERYGSGGFIYIGSGQYQPLYQQGPNQDQQAANYGATNA